MRRAAALCAHLPGAGEGDRALALRAQRRRLRVHRVSGAPLALAAARAGGGLARRLPGRPLPLHLYDTEAEAFIAVSAGSISK